MPKYKVVYRWCYQDAHDFNAITQRGYRDFDTTEDAIHHATSDDMYYRNGPNGEQLMLIPFVVEVREGEE